MPRTPAEILAGARTIALVGASPNPSRPSNSVMRYLLNAGYRVLPVRPHVREIPGVPCVASLGEIAVQAGAKAVWLQLGLMSPEARRIAEEGGLEYVEDECTAIVHRHGVSSAG